MAQMLIGIGIALLLFIGLWWLAGCWLLPLPPECDLVFSLTPASERSLEAVVRSYQFLCASGALCGRLVVTAPNFTPDQEQMLHCLARQTDGLVWQESAAAQTCDEGEENNGTGTGTAAGNSLRNCVSE